VEGLKKRAPLQGNRSGHEAQGQGENRDQMGMVAWFSNHHHITHHQQPTTNNQQPTTSNTTDTTDTRCEEME
jgi:hypothetical protein